jgi:hypothetical protein
MAYTLGMTHNENPRRNWTVYRTTNEGGQRSASGNLTEAEARTEAARLTAEVPAHRAGRVWFYASED